MSTLHTNGNKANQLARARTASIFALFLLAGLAFCRPAAAQGFFVSGGLMHAAVNETVIDDTRNAYKFVTGYEFKKHFGIEVGWVNFGEFDGVILQAGGSTRVGYDAKTMTAALLGRIPLGDHLAIYAKGGYLYWSTDVQLTGTAHEAHYTAGTDHGNDPFFGGGIRYKFESFSIFAEWERYKLNQVHIDAITAGLRYTFGCSM